MGLALTLVWGDLCPCCLGHGDLLPEGLPADSVLQETRAQGTCVSRRQAALPGSVSQVPPGTRFGVGVVAEEEVLQLLELQGVPVGRRLPGTLPRGSSEPSGRPARAVDPADPGAGRDGVRGLLAEHWKLSSFRRRPGALG